MRRAGPWLSAGFTRGEAKAGAVTVIQRFGSAAGNLNIHFHSLVIDGVYRLHNGKPVFEHVAPPTTEELARLLERIAKRVMRLLSRCGDVVEEAGVPVLEAGQGDEALAPLQTAACSYRIAYGPRRGHKVWTIKMAQAQPREEATGCVHFNGFSLHAATEPQEEGGGQRPRHLSWARLHKRVFDIDISTCAHCGGALKIVAAITDAPLIRKILTAMGLSAHPPPRFPARYDPLGEATLYQAAGQTG